SARDRVVDRLHANPLVIGRPRYRGGHICYIAGDDGRAVGCEGVCVDDNPVVHFQAEDLGKLCIRDNTDTDEYDLRGNFFTVGQTHRFDVALVVGDDLVDLCFQPDIQAPVEVFFQEVLAGLFPYRTTDEFWAVLQDRDVFTELVEGRGGF